MNHNWYKFKDYSKSSGRIIYECFNCKIQKDVWDGKEELAICWYKNNLPAESDLSCAEIIMKSILE